MTQLTEILQIELSNLSLYEYFKRMEKLIDKSISLNILTNFFTDKEFTETKPYLTRRKLLPKDKRFSKIEIVYDEKIKAIVWDLNISLSNLTKTFGKPIMHNNYYDESTEFAFKSENPNIEIIKTRHPESLKKLNGENTYKFKTESGNETKIDDPEFSFIQFSLKD